MRHQNLYQAVFRAQNILASLENKIKDAEVMGIGYPFDETEQGLLKTFSDLLKVVASSLNLEYLPTLQQMEEMGEPDGDSATRRDEQRLDLRIGEVTRIAIELTEIFGQLYDFQVQVNFLRLTPIDRLCRNLYPGARLIIRPQWEYNFTYYPLTREFQRLIDHAYTVDSALATALRRVVDPEKFYFILRFPQIASDNVLSIAALAHEIGHFVDYVQGELKISESGKTPETRENPIRITDLLLNDLVVEAPKCLETGSGTLSEADATSLASRIAYLLRGWAAELFADILSVRLFGPAALFALWELTRPTAAPSNLFGATHNPNYPPIEVRLRIMYDEFKWWESGMPNWLDQIPADLRSPILQQIELVCKAASASGDEKLFGTALTGDMIGGDVGVTHLISKALAQVVETLRATIDEIQRESSSAFISPEDIIGKSSAFADLRNGIPPRILADNSVRPDLWSESAKYLGIITNVGWFYWLSLSNSNDSSRYNHLNQLLFKAMELLEATRWYRERAFFFKPPKAEWVQPMADYRLPKKSKSGALSRNGLLARIRNESLIVHPLLDEDTQISGTSLDLRLGTEIVSTDVLSRPTFEGSDLSARLRKEIGKRISLPLGKPFALSPGQYISAVTLEYIVMPDDLMGLVFGRSSLQRIGLNIANENLQPSFRGCLTFQAVNNSNVPILLYPGSRIASIVFFVVS